MPHFSIGSMNLHRSVNDLTADWKVSRRIRLLFPYLCRHLCLPCHTKNNLRTCQSICKDLPSSVLTYSSFQIGNIIDGEIHLFCNLGLCQSNGLSTGSHTLSDFCGRCHVIHRSFPLYIKFTRFPTFGNTNDFIRFQKLS